MHLDDLLILVEHESRFTMPVARERPADRSTAVDRGGSVILVRIFVIVLLSFQYSTYY
jgi:hypothetical protein